MDLSLSDEVRDTGGKAQRTACSHDNRYSAHRRVSSQGGADEVQQQRHYQAGGSAGRCMGKQQCRLLPDWLLGVSKRWIITSSPPVNGFNL
jgi:hypothetical protein